MLAVRLTRRARTEQEEKKFRPCCASIKKNQGGLESIQGWSEKRRHSPSALVPTGRKEKNRKGASDVCPVREAERRK